MARTKQTARPGHNKAPRKTAPAAGGKKHKADKAPKAPKVAGVLKAPRRYRPGTVALRKIRKYQKETKAQVPRTAFRRLVREVVRRDPNGFSDLNFGPPAGTDWRIQSGAVNALQTLTESFLTRLFLKAYLLTASRGTPKAPRQTCDSRDLILAYKIGVPISENIREPVADAMAELQE